MVFVCSSCNSSLKKNQIPQHRCNAQYCCLTCNVEFNKISSQSHDACISEAEKYRGIDFKSNGKENKGMDKQKSWNDIVIQSINQYETSDASFKEALNAVKSKPNIPQKLNKFLNFVNSIPQCKRYPKCGQKIWDIISVCKSVTGAQQKPSEASTNADSKKRKIDEASEVEEEPSSKKAKTDTSEKSKKTDVNEETTKTKDNNEATEKKKKKKKEKTVEIQDLVKEEKKSKKKKEKSTENPIAEPMEVGEPKLDKKSKKKKEIVSTEAADVKEMKNNEPKDEKKSKKKVKHVQEVATKEQENHDEKPKKKSKKGKTILEKDNDEAVEPEAVIKKKKKSKAIESPMKIVEVNVETKTENVEKKKKKKSNMKI